MKRNNWFSIIFIAELGQQEINQKKHNESVLEKS